LHDLLTLRKERHKAEIGFESQKRSQAEEVRRDAREHRKAEQHQMTMSILETRLEGEKANAIVRAIAAASKMEGFLPAGAEKIAA
jgi:hypothetical protein